MRVTLAGYNIDSQVLEEARLAGVHRDRLTPEVLSAAYARISRDPRPVGELRKEALDQVEKARKSNRRIIFGMGHHSVAEHAVFNFDILGVSRLAIEALEHFRLCSFTEKSQRYITLDHDFVVPVELRGTSGEARLCELVLEQARLYTELNAALHARLEALHPDLAADRAGRSLIDGWAKEDARYVTLLATSGQLGFTANARNLEHIVRRLAAQPLEELKELGTALYSAGLEVAPSLLLFTAPAAFDVETDAELRAVADEILSGEATNRPSEPAVRIVGFTPNADTRVAAAMLARASRRGFDDCLAAANALSRERLADLFEASMRRMEFFDAPRREFEHAAVTFELVMSAACYAQLKRHRMSTQTARPYDPALGITIPPAIVELRLEDKVRAFAAKAEVFYAKLLVETPHVAPYALTNAHRRRVLMTVNLRELYHFSRLREDAHAQWDIRDLACAMREAVEEVAPLCALLLCGKDGYVARFERCFGRRPIIDPATLG